MLSLFLRIVQFIGITALSIHGNNAFPLLGTETGCGGTIANSKGFIKSPGYPQRYPKDTVCVWIIHVPDINSTISLKFQAFSLERHPHCRYDYILVRDGDSQLAPILGKFCGNDIPDVIRSKRNTLWIRFYSDSAMTGNGFIASYNQINSSSSAGHTSNSITTASGACGGRVTGSSGEIGSPRWYARYPNRVHCKWLIENDDPYAIIRVAFGNLDINENERCLFDYVMIEDVSPENERLLGRFCGSSPPSASISGKRLRISYNAEEFGERQGFKLKWIKFAESIGDSESQDCGGVAVSTAGFLKSMYHPDNYHNDIDCRWSLSAPDDSHRIQLRFANFDLEQSLNCTYDYLEVYDGRDENSPLLGRYCGRQISEPIESTQKYMFLLFKTDSSDTATGFEGAWITVTNPNNEPPSGVQRLPSNTGMCGGVLTAANGTITTPNYPSKYPPNADCIWIIKANVKYHIKLTFFNFDIENHPNCKYDKVTIRDGLNVESKILKEICGDFLPTEIISNGESLWIRFKTDSSKELPGFLAKWQFVLKSGQRGCGTNLKSQFGELSSPGYPSPAKSSTFCTWSIEVDENFRVKLTFNDIELKPSASCLYGYVQVSDGSTKQSPELGRFCQAFLPIPILSSGNKIFVGYQPDSTLTSRGFNLKWEAIRNEKDEDKPEMLTATPCNLTLTASSGTIILQKGVRHCSWLIRPSNGSRIALNVVKANILPNPHCDIERLYVRDGFTSTAPLLLKICGRMQGTSVSSSTRVLKIEYEHFRESNEKDIKIQWRTVQESVQSDPATETCGMARVAAPEHEIALAESGMLPWMASLRSGSGFVSCGAAILSSKWLLTAAHCLRRYPHYAFHKITVGDLNLFKTENTEQHFEMKLFHIHPEYNSTTHENDIALIQIEGQIGFNDDVNAICLPQNDTMIPPHFSCLTAGWGTPIFLGRPSTRLVMGKIAIIPLDVCNDSKAYKEHIKDNMFCAGSRSRTIDTCQGDGGGPLVCKISQDKHAVIGISSWGNGCGHPEKYGVYTDVRKHTSWIHSIMWT